MLIKNVMTKKVVTVSLDESFPQIVKLLTKKKISGVVVVDKKGKAAGVISEKDLFNKLFPSQKLFYKNVEYYMNYNNIVKDTIKLSGLKAKNIMSKKIISVESEDHILKACSLFIIHHIRRLPVIDNGKLMGIVTTNNIYKNFLMSLIK
jgi:CBS domain-containing protein